MDLMGIKQVLEFAFVLTEVERLDRQAAKP